MNNSSHQNGSPALKLKYSAKSCKKCLDLLYLCSIALRITLESAASCPAAPLAAAFNLLFHSGPKWIFSQKTPLTTHPGKHKNSLQLLLSNSATLFEIRKEYIMLRDNYFTIILEIILIMCLHNKFIVQQNVYYF